ncbi:hypothetical protein BLOT_008890 [Blomia tropicalis]|nr:hypothetical protein BLOT_008890 [Blomia tropicalis]
MRKQKEELQPTWYDDDEGGTKQTVTGKALLLKLMLCRSTQKRKVAMPMAWHLTRVHKANTRE